MTAPVWKGIVVGVFALIALLGTLLSLSAPHLTSDDEHVYLTGALEARDGNLPDAYMLQGYDYGPYLYPKLMLRWYEPLGHDTFKTISLWVLVLATGLAAFVLFRVLGLPNVPSLALAVVALMPRFAAGTEFFGILTFREAVGRAAAVPLFLVATGFLLQRMQKGKSLWPVFLVVGLFVFLHPVTVTLYAVIALLGVFVVRIIERRSFVAVVRELIASGAAFALAGSYFFIHVFDRLGPSTDGGAVLSADYVSAVAFRNAWEFPAASFDWYRHMFLVSALFLALLVAYHALPALRRLRERYALAQAGLLLRWGIAVALLSLMLAVAIPGANLYLMAHADAPYVFQQWSRLAKFYYLGLFVALIPVAYVLWRWYRESRARTRHVLAALTVAAGVASSSVFFEVAQFAVGYPNYTATYVPQALSGKEDGVTPEDYRDACEALRSLGAGSDSEVISPVFGLRYWCRADLYVTFEEGAAYTYLSRADLVDWHTRIHAQREALLMGDPETVLAFARTVGADYIVVSRQPRYESFEALSNAVVTERFVVLRATR